MTSFSIADLAQMFDVSKRTVRVWIEDDGLRAVNVSRSRSSDKPRLRILPADLDAFLAGRAVGGESEKPKRNRRSNRPVKQYV